MQAADTQLGLYQQVADGSAPHWEEEKVLSKTAQKKLEVDARALGKANFIKLREFIMSAKDDSSERMKRYERMSLPDLKEVCVLKKLSALRSGRFREGGDK